MVEGHHQLSGHEFEQTPGDIEGQESLTCCSSWDRKESDTTWHLNNKQGVNCWGFLKLTLRWEGHLGCWFGHCDWPGFCLLLSVPLKVWSRRRGSLFQHRKIEAKPLGQIFTCGSFPSPGTLVLNHDILVASLCVLSKGRLFSSCLEWKLRLCGPLLHLSFCYCYFSLFSSAVWIDWIMS